MPIKIVNKFVNNFREMFILYLVYKNSYLRSRSRYMAYCTMHGIL